MVVIPVIGFGAFIEPFLYVSMTVGKIKTAGPVVLTGGEVDNLPAIGRDRVEAPHLSNEIAVVDAIVPLIEKNKRFCGRGCGHVADLFYDRVPRSPRSNRPCSHIIISQPIVHRHGAHVGKTPASEGAHTPVGWAAPHAEGFVVLPKMAFHQVKCVGVIGVVGAGPPEIVALVQSQPATDPG